MPLSTSSAVRTTTPTRGGANSLTKIATSTPTGSDMAAANATSTSEPTKAFASPPPGCPKSAWFFVKRSQLSAGSALTSTETTTSPSTPTASAEARSAASSIARFFRLRRRSLLSMARLEALDDHLRGDVHREREDEQDQREVDERRHREVRERTLVLVGDPAGERVAELEERDVDALGGADHLRDGDRLAERPAEAEQDRRHDAPARVREHDPAHH